jgi:putative acetyltransferase
LQSIRILQVTTEGLPEGLIIRPEAPADLDAIRALLTAAFGRPDEAALVDSLRLAGNATLSLVADLDGRVVGPLLFSPMRVEPPIITAVGLGPLAVLPEIHGRGIGSRLTRVGIAEIRRRSIDAVFLLGNPAYYARFGFAPAVGLGVTTDVSSGHFQFIEMWEGAVGSTPLRVRFAPEFDALT